MKEPKFPYKTSRDYKKLISLLDNGYKIVCLADYRWNSYVAPLRDICTAIKSDHHYLKNV